MSTNRSRIPSLAGRDDALQAIRDLVERAGVGAGGGLTLVGEPGIGKSALIDRAAAMLVEDPTTRVVHLRGVEAELELPWSSLAVLLDGMLGRLDQLAPARREALEGALAMAHAAAPVEPFAVSLATRDLLIETAEVGTVVVFVDDLPWVDLPSRRALAFWPAACSSNASPSSPPAASAPTPRRTPGRHSCSKQSATTSPTRSCSTSASRAPTSDRP